MTSLRAQLATCLMAAFLLMEVLGPVRSFPRQLSEGERCWDRGMAGRCRSLQDCEHARWALQGGRTLPTRCGFVGYQEVVCCTNAEGDADAGDRNVRDNDVDSGGSLENDSSYSMDSDSGNDQIGSWDTRRPAGSSSPGSLNIPSSNSRHDDRGNQNFGYQLGSWDTHKPTDTFSSGSRGTHNPAGASSPGSWNIPSSNSRDSDRGNQNMGDQLGSWDTHRPTDTFSPGSRETRKPAGDSSPGSWNTPSSNSRDSDRGNQNLGGQLGSQDTHRSTDTFSPGSRDTRKPPGASSAGSWNTPNSNSRDNGRGNQNLGGHLGSWDTRKPTDTFSPDSRDTRKPAGTSSSGRWKSDNSDSRDGHPENDSGNSRDNQRGSGNLGNQLGSWNTRKPDGTSSEGSAQACESYKNFLNGPTIRILSGKNAQKEEFPHMAALGYELPGKRELSWNCGGSLISDQYVLTAAHCCSSKERSAPVRVQLGTLNLGSSAPGDQRYGVREIIIHPDYSKPNYKGDIALIKLDRKVSFSETVCPACLYTKSGDPQTGLVVTGWGATNALGTRQSPVLLKSTIRPFPLLKCEQMYKERFPEGLDSTVLCAGDPQGKGGTCDGDSGGPLQIKEDVLIFSVVGITSMGPSPCGGTSPTLYTRVYSYIEWIEKHVWP